MLKLKTKSSDPILVLLRII